MRGSRIAWFVLALYALGVGRWIWTETGSIWAGVAMWAFGLAFMVTVAIRPRPYRLHRDRAGRQPLRGAVPDPLAQHKPD